jgi:predicted RNA-binding protein YlqC (UPF0109 family)
MADINITQTLKDMVKIIVDNPDEVLILETVDGDNIALELKVAESDMGKIIGKHGRIAKALRMVIKAAANSIGKKVTVEIK